MEGKKKAFRGELGPSEGGSGVGGSTIGEEIPKRPIASITRETQL